MSENYGKDIAAKAIAKRLDEMLPNLKAEADLRVIAESLVEHADIAAVETINTREGALQETLVKLMEYYTQLNATHREQIAQLRVERDDAKADLMKLFSEIKMRATLDAAAKAADLATSSPR